MQRELGLDRVVKLASNEGPFAPFPAALEAIARGAEELNRYPDGGSYRLHEGLAERHDVRFEEVSPGAGADGTSTCSSQAALDPGDEIVCGWPSFPSYVDLRAEAGRGAARCRCATHRYDLEAMLEAVGPKTKIVYLCHPNNPTGTMNTRAELDAFFDPVPEHVLTSSTRPTSSTSTSRSTRTGREYVKAGRRAVVLRTFSKIYGLAGLRVGYAVGPAEV